MSLFWGFDHPECNPFLEPRRSPVLVSAKNIRIRDSQIINVVKNTQLMNVETVLQEPTGWTTPLEFLF